MQTDIFKLENTYNDLEALAFLVGSLSGLTDLNENSFSLVTSFLESEILERTQIIEEIFLGELKGDKASA